MAGRSSMVASDTDTTDIRAWLKDRDDDGNVIPVVPDEQEGSKPVGVPDDRGRDIAEEIPPRVNPPGVAERARQRAKELASGIKKAAPPTKRAAPSASKAIKPKLPRLPVDRLISRGWRMLAQMAQPINLPVARVIDMQAPVAGIILESTIKDTIVDRVLQPIARVEAGGEVIFALIGPPVLVAALTTKPHLAPALVPLLRDALRTWIDVAGPHLEKVEKAEAEFKAQYGKRIDEMIGYFLAPPDAENSAAE